MPHETMCPISATPCVPDPDGIHRLILTEPYRLCDACLRECHCASIARVRRTIAEGIESLKPGACPDGQDCPICPELARAVGVALGPLSGQP